MTQSLLMGHGRHTLAIPQWIWQRRVRGDVDLGFMSDAHHLVRTFVVVELPRVQSALSPEQIAQALGMSLGQVSGILDDLEAKLTFLFRNEHGAVAWAYPVTVDATPHEMAFSSGERINAAWAIDAIATPFVQGRLRGEKLSFEIESECKYSQRRLRIEIDSELNYRVLEGGQGPMVYVPIVDFETLDDPSIIDSFWRKSVFFWSEEEAKQYRHEHGGERGMYMTIAQSIYVTRIMQSALFGFEAE